MAALNTEFKENLQQESQDDQAKVPLLSSSNQYPSEGAEIQEQTGVEGHRSENNDEPHVEKTDGVKYLCGLAVKKETTVWNLIAMPLIPFITCTINFYAMTFMPLLLANKDYFAIP